MAHDFWTDIETIGAIEAVPTLLRVVCRVTGMGFSAIARVTGDRWVCLAVNDEIAFGLKPGDELKVETTLCHEVRQSREAIVIEHVAENETYCGHRTPAMYGFQSYISIPIFLKDGSFFGTLCAIDPRPARLTGETVDMFQVFARLIAFHIDAVARVASSEANLMDERAASELREQFIAILGHDLRNPLASIAAGATLLQKTTLTGKAAGIVTMMQTSVARMSALIDNVLDFARGRLGGGLTLNRASGQPLEPLLQHVIAELRSSNPGRAFDVELTLREPVVCDHLRIGQLLSNLLGNALAYGATDKPIRVRATTDGKSFDLSVANAGEPIPPAAMERLFLPFSRGAAGQAPQGLGLGLYIASEIARAHGGTIEVASTPAETRFTFRMPLA